MPLAQQVGWDNPAELKAAKLARSVTRRLVDTQLKPNGDERRRIAAVLRLPPNKPLSGEARALLWRFRFALVPEKRALTKFLKCVDWGDAQEAKQVCYARLSCFGVRGLVCWGTRCVWGACGAADAMHSVSKSAPLTPVCAHIVLSLALRPPS